VLNDLLFGCRRLWRHAGLSAIVILSIAVGVSASSTVFAWINSIVRDPLPAVPESRQLVVLATRASSGNVIDTSYADYRDWRDQSRTLQGLIAYRSRPLSLEHRGDTRRVWSMFVTSNYFETLRLQPTLGRFFDADARTDTAGGERVAIVSHDFWRSVLGSERDVVGQRILLNRQAYTLIGVAPAGFAGTVGGLSFDVWVPLLQQQALLGGDADWIENREFRALQVMGRRALTVTTEQVAAEMRLISSRLAEQHPDQNVGIQAAVYDLNEAPVGAQALLGRMLSVLWFASLLVLVIVCVNLMSILLVATSDREREIGVRIALGAQKSRVARQLLTEGVVLSLCAAVLSLLFTAWASRLLGFFAPVTGLPVLLLPRLGVEVWILTMLLALGAGFLAGLLPALRGTTLKLVETLKQGRGNTGSAASQKMRAAFTAAEIALAFVALTGAVGLVRSFDNIAKVDPGFDRDNVALLALSGAEPGRDAAEMSAYYRRVVEHFRSQPDVSAVSIAEIAPLGFKGGSWEQLHIEGYAPAVAEDMKIYRNLVSEDYFDVMRIRLVAGREFTTADDDDATPVVIVNETFARRYFSNREVLGRTLRGWGQDLKIVGIVADSKYASLTETALPYVYVPFAQFATAETEAIVHISAIAAPREVLQRARSQIASLGTAGYVVWSMTLREYAEASLFQSKIAAVLLSVLAGAALALATLGIYGVSSHSVRQRTNELGIRIALGALPEQILQLVLGRSLLIAGIGIVAGVVLSLAAAPLLTSLLYGVDAIDVQVHAEVAALLVVVTVLGSAMPAMRAIRIDPATALRSG